MVTRHTLRLPAFAIMLGVLEVPSSTARVSTRQLTVLRPLDATRPITYFIGAGSGRTGFRSSDRQLAVWAFEAWQRNAVNALRFEPASESAALVRIYWAEPAEGQYGEMQPLVVDGRPGAAVFIRPDMDSLGQDIARHAREDALLRESIVYLTCLHELGHALGLAHTRDFRDVMYFFGYGGDVGEFFGRYRAQLHTRNDIAATSGLSHGDVSHLRALYVLK
jgi:hypothetical protein